MITLKNVTKTYNIPHVKRTTLFEQIVGYITNQVRYEEFNALEDITLAIPKGEIIGLIGKNGSGKTTLLKMIAGIITPTKGSIRVKGKVAPFLGLGVGFHGELTAKENIFLYGAILGIPRFEIQKKLDKILSFAEVSNFQDLKLKRFSSGMIARLAFATMIETDPDILLLDEIFAVGDKDFKPKCEAIFKTYKKQGKTIILASHSLQAIEDNCTRTVLLDKGKIIAQGKTQDILEKYYEL
jgi:lipopolysaccharide transport system ATP-binding protein